MRLQGHFATATAATAVLPPCCAIIIAGPSAGLKRSMQAALGAFLQLNGMVQGPMQTFGAEHFMGSISVGSMPKCLARAGHIMHCGNAEDCQRSETLP